MIFNIIFLKSKSKLEGKKKWQTANIIRNTAKKAVRFLNFENDSIINFTVYFFNKKYVGGFAQAEDWIQMSIPQKKELNEEELKSTIYHEIHHIKRGYVGYSKTRISLLEALFAEGLAIIFELEKAPKFVPNGAKYTKDFIKKWLPQVKKERFKASHSHDEWFFGARGKPFLLGYKIGTYLARQIKKNHPDLTSEKLVNKSVKELLRLSKVDLV